MNKKSIFFLLTIVVFFLYPAVSKAQISAPGSSSSARANYPVFGETDSIFVFCAQNEGAANGALRVQTALEGTKTFLWEKYNNVSGEFEFYFSESTSAQESTISSLTDGGYRATITQGTTTQVHRAWVFNDWFSATAEITDSNCESFKMNGAFDTGGFIYYDLANNTEINLSKNVQVEWKSGQTKIASVISPQIFNPPTQDTKYTLRVYDQFGCEGISEITYESIVTKAKFSVDQQSGEAPLTVTFTNESENGTPGAYEWFFFRDLDEIKRESENSDQPVDSIMVVAYDDSPVFTYENSGTYDVKLVSKHISENQTCVDTTYLEEFIVADTSFMDAPNVFTPNNDGVNDYFVVKFVSMQSIKISIFNRWGKRVHFWESENVRGFEGTWMETIWDGRIGGRWASPGVYYYVVEGRGRDNEERRAHGFVHLFRD